MPDDVDPFQQLEQQINGSIINTVLSNLVSQINSLGNGRRRLDRKSNPYDMAPEYLQRKGIDITKAALKTRVSESLRSNPRTL